MVRHRLAREVLRQLVRAEPLRAAPREQHKRDPVERPASEYFDVILRHRAHSARARDAVKHRGGVLAAARDRRDVRGAKQRS
ncbi:MAG: hypothetical protein NVS3B27_14930 [Novosphingobium sp.]